MKQKQPHGPAMKLGNMRELGLALIFGLTLCAEVKAEVTYLTCAGTMQQSDVLQPAGSDTTRAIDALGGN
jgi:hypothetical protein